MEKKTSEEIADLYGLCNIDINKEWVSTDSLYQFINKHRTTFGDLPKELTELYDELSR